MTVWEILLKMVLDKKQIDSFAVSTINGRLYIVLEKNGKTIHRNLFWRDDDLMKWIERVREAA